MELGSPDSLLGLNLFTSDKEWVPCNGGVMYGNKEMLLSI